MHAVTALQVGNYQNKYRPTAPEEWGLNSNEISTFSLKQCKRDVMQGDRDA